MTIGTQTMLSMSSMERSCWEKGNAYYSIVTWFTHIQTNSAYVRRMKNGVGGMFCMISSSHKTFDFCGLSIHVYFEVFFLIILVSGIRYVSLKFVAFNCASLFLKDI